MHTNPPQSISVPHSEHCQESETLISGPIFPVLLKFAIPILFAIFLQAMYSAIDLLIVGRFSGTAELSGVSSGCQLFGMLMMIVCGLSVGLTVQVGEAVGAKKPDQAGYGIGSGIVLFGIISLVMTAFVVPFSGFLSAQMHAPKEAFIPTTQYVQICGWGMLFINAYNLIGAMFRGLGDSKTPLLTVAIACVANILGDLLLVAVFDLGAAGAAIATVAAQGISVAISLWIVSRKTLPFHFSLKHLRPKSVYIRKILRIGSPLALQECLVGFSFVFIQVVVNELGVVASAATGVAERLCSFLMLFSSAFAQSISAFVAQNNGAELYERSVKSLKYGASAAVTIGVVVGVFVFFKGDILCALFSDDDLVIAAAHDYLRAYSIDCVFTAIFFCFVGFFNGCKKTIFVMMQGMIGAFCFRLPIAYFMSRLPDTNLFLIGLATPTASFVQILLCVSAYLIYSKSNRLIEAVSFSDE